MNIILALTLVSLGAFSTITAESSIRQPREHEGLTTDKTATSIADMKRKREAEAKRVRTGKRRKGLTHNRIIHTFSTMTFDELKVAKDNHREKKHFDIVEKYLERMIALCEDINQRADLIMELADTHFSQSEFDQAKTKYAEFERLYPGNAQIERAKKQMILCAQQGILSVDRDQSPTEETLRLTKEYLEREAFTEFKDEIATIKKECETLLAQSECGVTEFYIKQKNFKSAELRIKNIKDTYLDAVPEMAVTVAQLEVNLGTQWQEFEIPKESIKLAQTTPEKVDPKADMTARF
jgi:outer membrane assembly lipoprotein YfiO